ncbi:MAG: hypothetical protein A3D37_02050 [Candidatus Zambryskibacteria bacterium RIFCSPHIGHO2_02_FULL_38_22]|uniref:Uncharacterized protein n=1 Tax=Candidatus Zambryskibacteria bacterium RIFCSPLOWO2_12_FULL_39_16 TaxID=1802775 RepID=A0A1G2URF0_9BACT|nr:MAG: hypothetical protein A3D37_02050 [Candidatus Zambryskibacteria bacterium RIFCSPHIGHO2_02_FULL_38_22]OHB07866.1 MAG: hypothetical protein A3I19_02940 [Candidatus Zambryskibacteria bacterium RIFCSPLOWO2_02_FULL_38_13]OHB11961.1 MAG: hypothetical protein A3G46_01880 [Candidatus Zambryskibacteria bacterium RIFCSPLOWO2_12_FULL_39_16]
MEGLNVFRDGEPLLPREEQNELNEMRKRQMETSFKGFEGEKMVRFQELSKKEADALAERKKKSF